MGNPARLVGVFLLTLAFLALLRPARADEFTAEDLKRWEEQFMTVVKEGEKPFQSNQRWGV